MARSEAEVYELMRTDPAEFRRHEFIDDSGRIVRLSETIRPWQTRDFTALDESWRRVIGLEPRGPVYPLAALLRGRGCSKTSDMARSAGWPLWAAEKAVHGVVAAGSKDQARIFLNATRTDLECNPWKAARLEVQRNVVVNRETGSDLTVISADADLAFGLLPDFILCDEITHWGESGESLWHSLYSASGKRKNCLMLAISNAGTIGSWQHKLFELIKSLPECYFSETSETETLLSPKQLETQRRILPQLVYDRLFRNLWVPVSGTALSRDSILSAITLAGPESKPDGIAGYAVGMDLATTGHHAALVLLAADYRNRCVRLAFSESFVPGLNGKINLQLVQDRALEICRQFNATLFYDPYQAGLMVQQLSQQGVPCVETVFAGQQLHRMASAILQAFREDLIRLYDDPEMIDDLSRLSIEERAFGFKLTASADSKKGHCDRAFALAIALPAAIDFALNYRGEDDGPIFDSVYA